MSREFKYFLTVNIGYIQDDRRVKIQDSNNARVCLAFMTYFGDYAHIDDMFFGFCGDRIIRKSHHHKSAHVLRSRSLTFRGNSVRPALFSSRPQRPD